MEEKKELKLEELEAVAGGTSLSQEDIDALGLLLKMYSKTELVDMLEGICPKCKKKVADKSEPGYQSIVEAHYVSGNGK